MTGATSSSRVVPLLGSTSSQENSPSTPIYTRLCHRSFRRRRSACLDDLHVALVIDDLVSWRMIREPSPTSNVPRTSRSAVQDIDDRRPPT